MSTSHGFGFHFSIPSDWNRAWVWMWLITSPIWIALAFIFPVTRFYFGIWFGVFLILFGIPEWISVRIPQDPLPPLTHTIRHFLPNDLAFPLIYGFLGATAGRWLLVEPVLRYIGIGIVAAALGWLTTHFTVTYARPDPHPHPRARGEEAVPEGEATMAPPVIQNPRPF
jgi:hypothetical protein